MIFSFSRDLGLKNKNKIMDPWELTQVTISSMKEKFDPLSLEAWSPLTSGSPELIGWSREDAILKSHECGIVGHILRKSEGRSEYDDIIKLIQYYKSQNSPLFDAFSKALNLSDTMSIYRDHTFGDISLRGEVKLHKFLTHGICKNLDQPGFGHSCCPLRYNFSSDLASSHSNRVHKFIFNGSKDVGMVLLEVIGEDIAVRAPDPSISYAAEGDCGPLIPVRYHHYTEESSARGFDPQRRAWLEAEDNLFGFREVEEGCDENVIRSLVKMLKTATDFIQDEAKERVQRESQGFFTLSYLYVLHPDNHKVSGFGYMKCTRPSCENHSSKKCARCNSPYCSTDCQKSHWKEHKPSCKAIISLSHDSGSRPSALVTQNEDWIKSDEMKGMKKSSASMSGSGFAQTDKKVKTKHIDGEFVVKVQGNISPNCIFIMYDEFRRVDISFKADTAPGKLVFGFLQRHPIPYPQNSPYHGLQKSFLYARTEVEGIRIFFEKLAPWQQW